MAYAAVVDQISRGVEGGRRAWVLTIDESEAAAGDEWEVSDLPERITILGYKATLTAGTGTTLNPSVGNVTGFADDTQAHIGTQTTTAVHINDQTAMRAYLPTGSLFGRSEANNAAADHVIATQIMIVEGWI